jgi:CubicO group peptidase (beta-lactamase class C family)
MPFARRPRPLLLALVLLAAVCTRPTFGQAPSATPDPKFDRVADAVQTQMKELGVPGVALGILADGQVRTRAFGVTSVDHPLPVTDDTLFQIGSISKTFTGTAIMRLVEQGRLRLDDPIRKHLPRFAVKDADASARATVRDTLTHMGGWEGDFFDDPSSGDDALERIVERMAKLEQTAKVGEMWGYNNAGFYAAGRIIEVVTGKPFERALKELVFDPIGIEQAYLFPADVMTRRFVVGHGSPKGVASVLTPWPVPRAANAAGGITTNVGSMLRYAAFHMGDGVSAAGTRVLSSSSLTQMRTAVVPKAGSDQEMGLTWHLSRAGGLAVAEHGGGTIGQISQLRLVPERRFALAIVTNSGRGSRLNTLVLREAMEAYFGVKSSRPSRMTVDAAALAEYAGTYRRQFADVTVTVDGDALKLQVMPKMPSLDGKVPPQGPPQRLGFYEKDRLLALDGPNAGEPGGEFVRDAGGRVSWLRTGRIHRRVQGTTSTP